MIATSDVDGRFAHPVCYRGDLLRPSDHAAFTYALTRVARDEDEPLVVDTGGLLTPHGVARYAANHRPSSLATMVQQLGYRALAFGINDLAAPREGIVSVIGELRERGIPVIASNLRCAEERRSLCDALVNASDGPSIHLVNGRRTAVLSVLRPQVLDLVAPDRARGIELEPPREALERLTRMARDRGAELVVAVVDAGVEGGPIQLASQIDEAARPNLILVSGSHDILFARPTTVRPVLVGAPDDDAVEIRIRESEEMLSGYEMLAQPLEGRGVTVGEPVLDWIDRIGQDYCEAWGRPLDGGDLEEPIDVAGMVQMVANIMRMEAGADVAILNEQALDSRWRPAQPGALTASDIYIALEYDEPLQVAEVDASWLTQFARNAESAGRLVTPGLTWSSGASNLKVGGHPTEPRASYRVVTIRFLAAGGDAVLPALPAGRWQNLGESTLRTVVLDYLEADRDADPRQSLPNPNDTLEWVFRSDLDLSFSGSRIDNPRRRCTEATPPEMCAGGFVVDATGAQQPTYSTTQLSQSDVLTFGFQLDLAANAASNNWTWQNTGNLLYRTTWTEPTGGSQGGFVEAADQIRARSTLSWRGLRSGTDQWYIPDPTVDLFIESEFTEPDTRQWHWFLTRPTAGLRFQLLDKLQLQLVGGFQVQPFDPEGEVEPGIGATLTLASWDFLKMDSRFARLAFTFDYFLADVGDDNHGALRGSLDASFDLAGPLALVVRFNLLMQHERGQDAGIALSGTAGIRLGYLARAVGP